MSATTSATMPAVEPGSPEDRHRRSAVFQAASEQTRITRTHRHVAIANDLVRFLGLLASGWISDRFGRRPAFYVMLAEGAVFITLGVFATTNLELWIYGLLWSIGFLGFWGPGMILTAEVYPTRIRGVGNGFSWSIAWLFAPDHAARDLDRIAT